ncbi:N-acetylmuramoyl-L-alanine amidase [Anaerosporobacter sp.]|uniref:N-acetylmuramoyl-L-alanine amidase n=1 Tax=Anaerosporobacter sp. TaxID=1872529 RepID=UPI00286F98D0|nr:N-acetylmuramoyl-L-alanine amidase [Anaerosporobacter sp.]
MYGSLTAGHGYLKRKTLLTRHRRRRLFWCGLLISSALGVCLGLLLWSDMKQGIPRVQQADNFSEVTTPGGTEIVPEENLYIEKIEEESQTPKIAIDAGHGGVDAGCNRENVLEKEINLSIAMLLKDRLEEKGYDVVMIRNGDYGLSLEERVKIAEEEHADIFVSIHQNVCEESDKVKGIETWYYPDESGNNKRLAGVIHQQTMQVIDTKDRGLRESAELYVIRETSMPSCLIETGFMTNKKERELLATKKYQKQLAEGIAQGIEFYFHPKTMYLTFDDGPSKENTIAILDILKERNIKATFFVVGENVLRYPEIARRIVDEGHTIGIHCNQHDYEAIYANVDSYVADFEKAYEIVREVTGAEAKLFRFPGGSINAYNKDTYEDIIAEMEGRGFVYFDWNAGLEDAVTKADPEVLIKNAKESTLKRKKVIMLAHDTVHATAVCLEELLDQFPEYQMKPLTEEVLPIQF